MNVSDLVKKIQEEKKNAKADAFSHEGMLKLQQVASTYDGEYRLIWSHDIADEMSKRPKIALHGTGLKNLDGIIGGFKEQQLVTISAHSKHGKTQFGLFIMEQLEKLAPVMIPLEQSAEELVQQRLDNKYSLPRFLSPKALAARVTVDWIEQRVVEGIAKYNTKLVLIDHLGYIDDFGESGRYAKENLAYRIETIMKSLKNIAKRWNVTILLLVHISQSDEGKPPSNIDLKGSSSILQESDMVMFLWRKNEMKNKVRVYSNKTMVSVTANRRTGRNGNIGLEFDMNTGKYIEEDSWVNSMMKKAEASIAADELFDAA